MSIEEDINKIIKGREGYLELKQTKAEQLSSDDIEKALDNAEGYHSTLNGVFLQIKEIKERIESDISVLKRKRVDNNRLTNKF